MAAIYESDPKHTDIEQSQSSDISLMLSEVALLSLKCEIIVSRLVQCRSVTPHEFSMSFQFGVWAYFYVLMLFT